MATAITNPKQLPPGAKLLSSRRSTYGAYNTETWSNGSILYSAGGRYITKQNAYDLETRQKAVMSMGPLKAGQQTPQATAATSVPIPKPATATLTNATKTDPMVGGAPTVKTHVLASHNGYWTDTYSDGSVKYWYTKDGRTVYISDSERRQIDANYATKTNVVAQPVYSQVADAPEDKGATVGTVLDTVGQVVTSLLGGAQQPVTTEQLPVDLGAMQTAAGNYFSPGGAPSYMADSGQGSQAGAAAPTGQWFPGVDNSTLLIVAATLLAAYLTMEK
jgi:hypothetical protein